MSSYKFPPTAWIWSGTEDTADNKLFLFRKTLNLDTIPESAMIKVSADTRYRLYVNGHSVSYGPCKGDGQVWYYETVDIAPYLRKGDNVIAAEVLRLSPFRSINHSIWRTNLPGLYFNGELRFADCSEPLIADETWMWRENTNVCFVPEDDRMAYLDIFESASGDASLSGWTLSDYDENGWMPAVPRMAYQMRGSVSPWNLLPRPIPQMYENPAELECVKKIRKSTVAETDWNGVLRGKAVVIEADSEHIVEFDAGELTTGFLEFGFIGGEGAKIEIMTAESYVYENPNPKDFMAMPLKGDRTDSEGGFLQGFTDRYTVGGYGSDAAPENYEPFWFRTFRFIQLRITTSGQALKLKRFAYRETGYPLEAKTVAVTSDNSLPVIWDISLRTLRRCMHETYEDCPFYEQLQYAMDARTQILYTYSVSADDRMARRAIDDYHRSLRYDGLTNCCWPTMNSNVIPGFSLYYIMMIHDHMMYFGDRALVERYLPTVDAILAFFARNTDERGLVGQIGGVIIANPFWSFIDWAEHGFTSGVPNAIFEGSITMESFLYAYTLDMAGELSAYAGRIESANIYRDRAAAVKSAINKYCLDKDGLYQDGPGVRQFSQHCQVWAVLTETAPRENRKTLMTAALEREDLPKCSVAMAFYLFRALEMSDMYDKTDKLWKPWRDMIENNLTTCVENDTDARSDCHAWGSLALYELPSVVLGVRPAKPGYSAVSVKPNAGYFEWAKGSVITPRGEIQVEWHKDGGEMRVKINAPDGVEIIR
ncbi:MAG: hypothetical protein FWG36_06520 [Oscillospiraceae bacterium]|nr:hypothetical protein [Oscillospiraceae bacterium]